jgi:hypothetical protein
LQDPGAAPTRNPLRCARERQDRLAQPRIAHHDPAFAGMQRHDALGDQVLEHLRAQLRGIEQASIDGAAEHLTHPFDLLAMCLVEFGPRDRFTVDLRDVGARRKKTVVALDAEEGKRWEDQQDQDKQQHALVLSDRVKHA